MLMRYHGLFEDSNIQSFVLHPALNPEDYQITKNFRGFSRWKARCYLDNNSMGTKGAMDEVGYVWISNTTNVIIPIARGDEHNRGGDLVWSMNHGDIKGVAAGKIDMNDFIPFWVPGPNYLYRDSDIEIFLPIAKKALAYGAPDSQVIGTVRSGKRMLPLSDFVNANGNVEIEQGTLAPYGQRIYDVFRKLGDALRGLDNTTDRIRAMPAFQAAAEVLKLVQFPLSAKLGLGSDQLKNAAATLKALQKENDIQGLSELFFGFHGIKNEMHTYMKKHRNGFFRDDVEAVWGDIDLAIDMLARF